MAFLLYSFMGDSRTPKNFSQKSSCEVPLYIFVSNNDAKVWRYICQPVHNNLYYIRVKKYACYYFVGKWSAGSSQNINLQLNLWGGLHVPAPVNARQT